MTDPLALLIRSGNPLISIESIDEARATAHVREVVGTLYRPLFEWSYTTGLRPVDRGEPREAVVAADKPVSALRHIADEPAERGVYVFHDLGLHTKDALVHRTMRDIMSRAAATKVTLILIDALPLPDEIRRFSVRHELAWPSTDELQEIVKRTYHRVRKDSHEEVSHKLSKRDVEHLVQMLRGLTCDQAERVVASAILDDFALTPEDLPRMIETKRTLLGSSGCLESIAADFSSDDIGGLKNLKGWLKQRRGGFSAEARTFGLESPRGVLMLGVPGCGKSLCAKVVAADWRMPLVRLDPGVLYQKYIGESESQLRQALRQAEAMSPAVLWIDEIEKAFASASAASADGGLSKRMFGTLLSWMQDHRHPIFIIATANDISAIPPELMRKGRFDEVFFVDLPGAEDRQRILAIHLKRRGRDPQAFDLPRVAAAAEGFSGAELEQVIVSGLFSAFSMKRELSDEVLLAEVRKTRPLSVLNAEQVCELRTWAADRCVQAD